MVERRNGQHPNHPHPDMVERSEQMREVWDRRRENETFTEIAEAMGISRSTAHKLFKEGLKLQMPQAAEEERLLQIQQQEELIAEAFRTLKRITDPVDRLKALLAINTLYKSRRDLMGLDAPTKFQGTMTHTTPVDQELQTLAEELARAQEEEARLYNEVDRRGHR
jgi:methylphosphotriester-DNA--protein-cysteine methyltransferase